MITFLSKAEVCISWEMLFYECSNCLFMCKNQLSFRFTTRKGMHLCAPPVTEEQWVKENIKFLDTRLKMCKETKFRVCNLSQSYHIFSHSVVVLVPQLSSIVLDDIKLAGQQACHCYCISPAAGHFLFSGFRLTHDFVYIVDQNLDVKVLLMQNHKLLNYETTRQNILLRQSYWALNRPPTMWT